MTPPVHLPVMAPEVVKFLVTDREGSYLDLTAGLGGHLQALAQALSSQARLYGLDKDAEAVSLARQRLAGFSQVKQVACAPFGDLEVVMDGVGENALDGILLDLGLSSYQLDKSQRGFSFRHEGPLDMRFDPQSDSTTAADLINSSTESQLVNIIRSYGEERQARRIARAIVRRRASGPLETTSQLAEAVAATVPGAHRMKSLARVFQAFRIAVNGELHCLEQVLPLALSRLKVGGRLAVISYHSLEDRLVKHFFRRECGQCTCPPRLPQCACGATERVRLVTRRAVTASAAEKQDNPRSRSARLRVVQRLAA